MGDGLNTMTPKPSRDSQSPPSTRLQFGWKRQLPAILQTEAAECSLACLVMVAVHHGHDVDLAGLRAKFPTSLKGVTLGRLMNMGSQLGFECRPVRLELDALSQLSVPCILHWDLNHFVVLKEVRRNVAVIHDPGYGIRRFDFAQVSQHFTGIALELAPSADFSPVQARQALPIKALVGKVKGLVPALIQILLLALALEALALVMPFYIQWILDQALVSADSDLLATLATGFIGITIFSALISAARSWAVTRLSSILSVQWSSNLFGHLMKLPLDWYEKRHVGDVVSRFGSIQAIQNSLSTQFVGTVLDGLMSLSTLAVMAMYSGRLTLLMLSIFALYTSLRFISFNPLRRANEEHIIYAAKQQSELLESIRGAMSIKLAVKQDERLARYANATVAATNRDIGIQRLTIAFSFANQIMFGVGRVAMIWIAAKAVLSNQLTAGMLIAYIAYADQFTSRSAGLIDKLVDFRMLKLHAERVADIALTRAETPPPNSWVGPAPEASFELCNVSFRYADGEPWILRNCDLKINAGECVAIVGTSGCGKSTLAKVMLGLLSPSEGEVRFGGVNIQSLGLDVFRQWVGCVMQDDQLFAGSIADNISFFDGTIRSSHVEAAAKAAAIHDDVVAMPMKYFSLIGDMGSSLSGGQRQRLFLARALYREPSALVLDEATSQLDVPTEREIARTLRHMDMTRLVIAHRPETLKAADRLFEMRNGHLLEIEAVH